MSTKPSSPTQQARIEKQKTASVEGAKAMAEQEAHRIQVRKNMERLRALRLAREAEEAALPKLEPVKSKTAKARAGAKTGAKTAAKTGVKRKAKAPALTQWLEKQKAGGRSN